MDVFELRRTFEAEVGPADARRPVRLELYQSLADPTRFRARAFEYEEFRLAPTFPQDDGGTPAHEADESLAAERSWLWLVECGRAFEATDIETAVRRLLADFDRAGRGE